MTRYVSTRDTARVPAPKNFNQICLAGMASDGGLFVPQLYPSIRRPTTQHSYSNTAARILSALAGDCLPKETAHSLSDAAYEDFAHHDVVPLVNIAPNVFVLELHHGPSLAFKDIAMQLLARLYETLLAEHSQRMTIICATSGDTGGAAAQAFAGNQLVDLVILYPDQRISAAQRRFMTTTGADNIHCLAIDSDFDTCQAIVKALFGDHDFRKRTHLSGVNSINWARIAAQSVYFATTQARLGDQAQIQFVVPTGNFGDALAAWLACRCNLLNTLDCHLAVNVNAAMAHLLNDGYAPPEQARKTLSPAMDIQIPSNFERLLFEASGCDPNTVTSCYANAAKGRGIRITPRIRDHMRSIGFRATSVSDSNTLDEIARSYAQDGLLLCPHTAVARHVARNLTASAERPIVILATAHPSKFPDTVRQATHITPQPPEHRKNTINGKESLLHLAADTSTVAKTILDLSRTGPA